MIELKHVSYTYRRENQEIAALTDLSLTIDEHTWLTVLGANGSGKTTLARLLNGLLLPTSGRVLVDGLYTDGEDEIYSIRHHVAYIFQNPDNQIVGTTVEEDIAFGPENLGLSRPEIRRRVDKALDAVGLGPYRNHAPHLLSGGQKQKVAVAGALAMEPRYLIMDEATAMLDPVGREEVLAAVQKLHREKGIAVINISHFMEEALLGQKILVLAQGCKALEGPTTALFTHADDLASLGLELPAIIRLGNGLRDYLKGALPLSVEEMVDTLCRLK